MASVLYSETHDPGAAAHVVHKGIALMRALGVSATTVAFPFRLPAVTPGGYVLINAGAAWPNKRWPAEKFGAVASAIRQRHGLSSVVLWGPGEESAASAIVEASRGAAQQAPPTTITEIFGLATRASLMISGDTGPLHIAGAVGTPIVALFGPTRAERNGPWSASDISISRYDQCVCHYERRCRRGRPCIDEIGVDEVMAAVDRRIAVR
jgi:ADP-heptose:LPS heptosyltransferase